MTYDNIKLDKGLYTSAKGFTASLEEIDPSENYSGTALEGLDAYQRQLKRFDIKVSGENSDSISKFFQTTDSAALFPEYVSRAVLQGMEEEDNLSKIIATTTTIDSLDYRAVESIPMEKELAEVAEGAYIPQTTIKTKERLTRLHKRGRMLVASYEAIKYQKLDLFTITLKQIGAYIARSQFADAIDEIKTSEYKAISSSDTSYSYSNLVDLWNLLSPYKMTTIVACGSVVCDLLKLPEFRDSTAGLNFHGTGNMITPLGAQIVKYDDPDLEYILALDKSAALEKVQAGGIITEYDKLIDRQLERAAITATAGFSSLIGNAAAFFALESAGD